MSALELDDEIALDGSLQAKQAVQVEWKDVHYTVKRLCAEQPKGMCAKEAFEDFTILKGLSGVVKPGEMLAIMGPSGSGKTTLLNVLSGIIQEKLWEGSVKINGQPVDRKLLKNLSSYLPQEDILFGSQTVFEAMMFYATLRLHGVSYSERKARVDALIDELGLRKVADSIIGYVGADATNSGLRRGLSGGERKRLSLGQQLITNPSLLFLDEPTTGLDSFAAESIVRTLQRQSMLGRTIIFTIHQPSADIMNMFDKFMLLGHGKLMYYGDHSLALNYFKSIGYVCPRDENPGDFLLEILHREPGGKRADLTNDNTLIEEANKGYAKTHERADALSDKFKESKHYASVEDHSDTIPLKGSGGTGKERIGSPAFSTALVQLLKRNFINLGREPAALRSMLMQSVIIALIFGAIYWQIDDTQNGIADRAGAIFIGTLFTMFAGMLTPFALFQIERKQFLFQTREGLYTTHSYFIAKVCTEVPKFFLNAVVFSAIFYWMVGLNPTAARFIVFVLFEFLITIAAFGFASVIVGAVPDPAIGLTIFPLLFIPMMIFSGFYTNSDNVPVYFIWAEWLSFIKYTFRGLMNNELLGKTFICSAQELIDANGVCRYTTGELWLEFRKLDDVHWSVDMIILAGFFFLLTPIAWYLMHRQAMNSKK